VATAAAAIKRRRGGKAALSFAVGNGLTEPLAEAEQVGDFFL
jgi:hypothetical protein